MPKVVFAFQRIVEHKAASVFFRLAFSSYVNGCRLFELSRFDVVSSGWYNRRMELSRPVTLTLRNAAGHVIRGLN